MRLIQLEPGDAEVLQVQFAADGRTLVAGLGHRELVERLCWWDLQKDRQVRIECGHEFPYQPPEWPRPAFSSDLRRWVVWGDRGHSAVVVWDRRCKAPRAAWLSRREYNTSPIKAVALSPDGRNVFASIMTDGPGDYFNCFLQGWEVETPLNRSKGLLPGEMSLSLDGRKLLVDREVSGSVKGLIQCLAVSPDGALVAGGTLNSRIVVWSWPDLEELMEYAIPFRNEHDVLDFGPPRSSATSLAFSPDGRQLAAVTPVGVAAWSLDTDDQLFAIDLLGSLSDVGYSPNSRDVAVACKAGGVMLLGTDGVVRQRFVPPIGDIRSVAYAPDGLTAAAGGERGQIVLWDLDD